MIQVKWRMMRDTLHNSQAKTLGGIGAILVLLSFVPSVGALFGLAGFVMVLMAVKYLADDFKEKKIFNDMMIAVSLSIVGIAVGSIVILGTVLNAFANGYFGSNLVPSTAVTTAQWITFGTALGAGLFVAWVFLLASAVFLRRSYSTIGSMLGVGAFRTAGSLYLIGAATAIVGVGFLLLFLAQILTAVAFWSIPVQPPQELEQIKVPAASPPLRNA